MNSISDYLTVTTPLPQYLPYARFLLDTDLSHTAKLLYTLLLDRATLSKKNNWIDAQGRIYVVYPLSHLSKDLGCSISSITRSFTELENAQLVERIRSGFSKPSRILLKVPHTTQNCTVIVSKNAEHDCAEMSNMIAQKCTPNQRNKNNLNDNHLIKSNNACLSLREYRNVFLTEKEYKRLKADFAGLDSLIEQLSASGVIVFVVSHDFEFIVRTCTEVVQLDDQGAVQNHRLTPQMLKALSEQYFH